MRRLLLLGALTLTLVACAGPTATPTPAFARHRADDVIRHLQGQGLALANIGAGTRPANSIAPNTYTDRRVWDSPGQSYGGQVFVFAEPSDLEVMRAWFARFPDLSGYVYVKHNTLMQLSAETPKAEAERFRAALEALP